MIIYLLASAVISLFGVVLLPFPKIGSVPAEVEGMLNDILSYVDIGFDIFYSFCYADVVIAMVNITVMVIVLYEAWRVALFVFRKIPFLGIN